MDVPNAVRNDYQLIDIEADGNLTVLDDKGETRADLRLPSLCESDVDLAKSIKDAFTNGSEVMITVLNSMGQDAVKAIRLAKSE